MMKVWIMSIVGITLIGVLMDVLLPKGNISKYIRGVFGMIVVLVVIAPIPKLLNSEIDFGTLIGDNSTDFVIDVNYIETINNSYIDYYETNIEVVIEKELGYEVDSVEVTINSADSYMLKKVKIILANEVINSDIPHINITNEIIELLEQNYNIKREIININV